MGAIAESLPRKRAVVRALATLGALLALAPAASAGISPDSTTLTVTAGDPTLGRATAPTTVSVPAALPRADIELAIDTTSSMGTSIAAAKADATSIVAEVQRLVGDSRFAVVQFKDSTDTPEYQLVQPMTANAAAVQGAIDSLAAVGGGDNPEAYNLVFSRSADAATGWRAGTRKLVIVIGDAEPHAAGTAGFAGCADAVADPHGLTTASVLAGMKAAQRTLFMIRQVAATTTSSLPCYASLAAAAFPTGRAIDHGGSLTKEIVTLIQQAFASAQDVRLAVSSASPAPASPSWLSFGPSARGPVPAPSSQPFDVTATVPAGTPAGTYSFDVVARADGVDIGHHALKLVVAPILPAIADRDADLVPDADDNCPTVANRDQADRDRDRIGDACDSLPPGDVPPVAGKTAVVRLVSGDVYVKLPGARAQAIGRQAAGDAPEAGFVPIKGVASLPVGSVVDARRGQLSLTSAAEFGRGGQSSQATVGAGIFQIRQQRARRRHQRRRPATTDLVLMTPTGAARACAAGRPAPAKGSVRALSGAASKGLVRTIAGASVTTVRKGRWNVADRCTGTLTTVGSGSARVFDRVSGRTVTVRAGQGYLVRSKLFVAKKGHLLPPPRA